MATDEKLTAWIAAVERQNLAAKALVAAIKVFQSGGPDYNVAWKSVEKAREMLTATQRRESKKWQVAFDPNADPQQDMPGYERPGRKDPKLDPSKAVGEQKGPKLLPGPKNGTSDKEE